MALMTCYYKTSLVKPFQWKLKHKNKKNQYSFYFMYLHSSLGHSGSIA